MSGNVAQCRAPDSRPDLQRYHDAARRAPPGLARLHKLGFLKLPQITVRFGPALAHAPEPVSEREREQEAADRIWARIVALYGASAPGPAPAPAGD